MVERRLIAVQGVVQGVGFRPYVHRLAAANGLAGMVRNDPGGVTIDVEGESSGLDAFLHTLTLAPPPTARIAHIDVAHAAPGAYAAFHIAPSAVRDGNQPAALLLPPDAATCDACLAELFDPRNRRFGHPFITCTACGPRLTVVRDTPYDRERTTMASFPMCGDCRREYEDPRDRRYHAESIACHACGPTLAARRGELDDHPETGGAAIDAAAAVLRDGGIVAVKALGGYHLACDATSEAAVARLRARKRRGAKPLAVMVRDLAMAQAQAHLTREERALLESLARPIVLLRRRDGTDIAHSVAPSQPTIGLMLPATPVHHLLLASLDRPLVMTSGNRSDEPVVIDEAALFAALGDVADLFLSNDRPIAVRCDDSVARIAAGDARLLRRARGHAPHAIPLPRPAPVPVLALGAHLKNAICVASGGHAFLSPHVGDLDTWAARQAFRAAVDGAIRITGAIPEVIAHDMHPEYASTQAAPGLAGELGIERIVAVQHHHAHVAACVAEHGVTAPVIGVAFDGAGLGTDGATWGGEFLLVTGASFRRCGHLAWVPLPGGDAAARRPWRSAAAHLASAQLQPRRPAAVAESEWHGVQHLLARPDAVPRTSSVGRLFDAVASLLGLCQISRFEGEAAMQLEAAADVSRARPYETPLAGGDAWTADPGAIVRGVVRDMERGRDVAAIAGAFHLSLRDLVVAGCERTRETTGTTTVALTGGVFMNALLLALVQEALSGRRFRVLIPRLVPCNDGGLALGQAHVAAHALQEDPCA